MAARAFIAGCGGLSLSADEAEFFKNTQPFGFILFARNCADPKQLKQLIADLRGAVGRDDAPVLIDQEGGRVQRLAPPSWRRYPSARQIGSIFEKDPESAFRLAYNIIRLMMADLHEVGISVDCIPVADVQQQDAHDVIGNRAYGETPETVAALARVAARAVFDGGLLPVIKHVPGHGRAFADSHTSLPVVTTPAETLRACDFAPFQQLNNLPVAMTAHVVYSVFDAKSPATQSAAMIDLIRNDIGFKGLLLTDDLSMQALSGSMGARASKCLAAGCDIVLHCNGDLTEMRDVAEAVPEIAGDCARRCTQALEMLQSPLAFDVSEALSDLDRVLNESV